MTVDRWFSTRPLAVATATLLLCLVASCEEDECVDCDDGDPCTIGECVDDVCVQTPACDDNDPCTVDLCGEDGECEHAPRCDDGLTCTLDTCNPDGSCTFTPQDSACYVGRDCMTSTCLNMPEPGPGQRVVPGSVSGCFDLLDDGYCTQQWDGCACNGAEMCLGSQGDVDSGCVSASGRAAYPCETAAGGDGNACTEEACCEPWDPSPTGCREHREIAAQLDEGEDPPQELFCDAVIDGGETVTVPTPLGNVECVVGDHQYGVPGVDPVVGEPLPIEKPDNYWCDDCEVCTFDSCDPETGACMFDPLVDGNQVTDAAEPWLPFGITIPAVRQCGDAPQTCDGVANYGCGLRACYSGTCAAGENANGDMSACDGFPVFEPQDGQVPAFAEGVSTCFRLGCADTAGIGEPPNWTCVAAPNSLACANGLICDGPGFCDLDEVCEGCDAEQVGTILVEQATGIEPVAPAFGNQIIGCAEFDPSTACDDGVPCTVEMCSEGAGCFNVADDRSCAVETGTEWDPCAPLATCDGEACEPGNGESPCGGTEACPIDCIPETDGRTCVRDIPECGPQICETEVYRTVALAPLLNLCPFHAPGTVPQGDRDFDGNGPAVSVDVALEINPTGTGVNARVHFEARETASDFSTLRWDSPAIPVYSSSGTVVSIQSQTTGHAYGLSADGGTVGIACGGCGVVDFTTVEGAISHVEARGDTPNDDISDDNNCQEDTLLELVELENIEILVREPCMQ